MGKGNRTKQQKAANVFSGTGKKTAGKKREMPTWVGTLIVVAVLAAVVLFSVFCILNSRGVFLRNKILYETDHFEITVPMMSYMVYSEYQNHLNTYQDTGYMQYVSGSGGSGVSTSIPLREQLYSSQTDKTTGVTTSVTWFDYFAGRATTSIEQILVLCEQAYRSNITLDEADYAEIDSAISMLELYAAYSGYTTSGYLAAMYGKGVSEKDVRAMMELSELATKYTNHKMEQLDSEITDARLEQYYSDNKSELDIYVDYIAYTFEVSFKADADNAKNEEEYAKYEDKKTTYAGYVDALAKCKTAEEFCAKLIECLEADGATSMDALQKQSDAHYINYVKTEDNIPLEKWLFDTKSPVKANDTHTIKNDGDAAREGDDATDEETTTYTYNDAKASYTACFVLKPVHRDTAYLQDVGHILFKTSTFKDLKDTSKLTGKTKVLAQRLLDKGETISAKNMAKELVAVMIEDGKLVAKTNEAGETYYYIEKADFEAYGNDYTEDSNVFYEDVARGDMVEEFDAWLYTDGRIVGETTPVAVETTYGHHIMYYMGQGEDINWEVTARDKICASEYEEWYKVVADACHIESEKYIGNWNKIN